MFSVLKKSNTTSVKGNGLSYETAADYLECGIANTLTELIYDSEIEAYSFIVKMRLIGGTAYNIALDEWADGYFHVEIRNSDLMTLEVCYQDTIFTPPESGIYYARIVSSYNSNGRKMTVSPPPESAITIIHITSGGFDEFGRRLYFNSASEAGLRLMPSEGLIFYDPFSEEVSVAASGQTMSSFSGVTFEAVNGIPAAKFTGQRVNTTELSGLSNTAPRSISAWLKATGTSTWVNAVGVGSGGSMGIFNVGSANGNAGFTGWGLDIDTSVNISDKMHHVCWTYDGTTLKGFVDGVQAYSKAQKFANADTPFYFGGSGGGNWYYHGYIASVRVYNRALSLDEVDKLKGEFYV